MQHAVALRCSAAHEHVLWNWINFEWVRFNGWVMSWSRSHKLTFLAIVATIAIAAIRLRLAPASGWDFRNNLWGPTHLLVAGRSPYNISQIFESAGAVWMPQSIGMLFPLGWLTSQQAYALWFGASIIALIAIVFATAEDDHPSLIRLPLALLVLGLFPPLVAHLRLGQISLLITLVYIAAALTSERWYAPILVALALTKPQLGVLVVPGLLIARWREGRYRASARFGAFIVLSAAVMTIPLFIAEPGWIADFVAGQQTNPSWAHPSLLVAAVLAFGQEVGVIVWAVLFACVFVVNMILWSRLPARRAVLWSLALTPFVTPYVWSWDFVLLFPLLSWLAFHLSPSPLVVYLIGYSIVWYQIISVALSGNVSNHLYWWIPSALVGVSVVAVKLDRRGRSPEADKRDYDL